MGRAEAAFVDDGGRTLGPVPERGVPALLAPLVLELAPEVGAPLGVGAGGAAGDGFPASGFVRSGASDLAVFLSDLFSMSGVEYEG
jgi:hypothetical protein